MKGFWRGGLRGFLKERDWVASRPGTGAQLTRRELLLFGAVAGGAFPLALPQGPGPFSDEILRAEAGLWGPPITAYQLRALKPYIEITQKYLQVLRKFDPDEKPLVVSSPADQAGKGE